MSHPVTIHLGFEVGSGAAVSVPLQNMVVTGQTQASGKTTTLEALVARSSATALTFVTKRGEGSFERGRRITPYFRDRADWQFVTSILDATLQEKNKFLRPWIMKICRSTKTLAEVQRRVREALTTAKGLNEGVYTQLDAYLDLIVPEIERAELAEKLDLADGLNVMDVASFATPMQMLFVQSALDWINEHCRKTIVVIPEAWEFIPEGKGSPVKASAVALVRKGSAIGNHIWVDSQDTAGVDKVILRGCGVWLIGVQREANEIARNLKNIPANIKRPSTGEVATLERGQFFACFGRSVVKVYVQPAWLREEVAQRVAMGMARIEDIVPPARQSQPKEAQVDEKEARALRDENKRLKAELAALRETLSRLERQLEQKPRSAASEPAPIARPPLAAGSFDLDAIYAAVKERALADPGILRVLTERPELEVRVERRVVQIDGASLRGRVARLLAEGFFDGGASNSGTRAELKRTGADVNNANLARVLAEFQRDGFLTLEGSNYRAVQGMKVNVVREAA